MRVASAALLVVLLAACGGSGGATTSTTTGDVDETAPVPAEVRAFVERIAEPGTVAFRATYRVRPKTGGDESTVEVVATPPTWELRAGDVVVQAGPGRQADEAALAGLGIFSRFFATGPADVLEADARRAGAGPLAESERTVLGMALPCAGVPLGGAPASTYCVTPEGIVGWADTPSVAYELTAYEPA